MTATDDDEFDEFFELSEAEQEAVLEREMAEYARWFNSLSPVQQYRHRRRRCLETSLRWRRIIRSQDLPIFREHLRQNQRSLLKARADFFHGVQGGVQ